MCVPKLPQPPVRGVYGIMEKQMVFTQSPETTED